MIIFGRCFHNAPDIIIFNNPVMKKSFLSAIVLGLAACFAACDSADTAAAEQSSQAIRLNVFYTLNDTADAAQATEIATLLVEASLADSGCITYDFLQSATRPGEYMIIETWENDSLLTLHSQAPHFTTYVPRLRALGTMRTDRLPLD